MLHHKFVMIDRDAYISFFHRVHKGQDVFYVPKEKQNERNQKKIQSI